MSARLIVIEGIDGAGTTTQAKLLVEHLRAMGRAAHLTREPSDGPIGRLIREMLIGQHAIPGVSIAQSTFGLLFAADRMDHVQREVEPYLDAGVTVVSDRWYHSSLAYQGVARQRSWLMKLNTYVRWPDLTIFLRVRPDAAAHRRLAAGRVQELFEDIRMQEEAAEGYEVAIAELMAERGERIEVVDGEAPLDAVFSAVVRAVDSLP